jgi:hypothetical protein
LAQALIVAGKWVGLGLGDSSPEVKKIKEFMAKKFPSYAGTLADTELYDQAMTNAVLEMQRRYRDAGKLAPELVNGIIGATTKYVMGYLKRPDVPRHIAFSVCGTGVPWNVGYPFDLCQTLDPAHWQHQPIGYPAQAFPMRPSYQAGVVELVRQMDLWNCTKRTWGFVSYSQGAIVTSIVLQRVLTGDLQQYKGTFIGGATFGNPMREAGHTLPGGIDPGGSGIVTPNLVGTPDSVWDMADGKKMVNSPGNDLYSTCGAGENAAAIADQRAVWDIVDRYKITSLAGAIAKLLLEPSFSGGVGAAEAAFGALNFFVAQGIRPHTAYGDIQPIPGDGRDSWRIALDHLNELGARVPARA